MAPFLGGCGSGLQKKKAHRRPDERVQSSQANRGCMLSGARRVHPVIVGGSLERRLDEGASSPLIIHVFDVADWIAHDFYRVDILVRDYDVREPMFDHNH